MIGNQSSKPQVSIQGTARLVEVLVSNGALGLDGTGMNQTGNVSLKSDSAVTFGKNQPLDVGSTSINWNLLLEDSSNALFKHPVSISGNVELSRQSRIALLSENPTKTLSIAGQTSISDSYTIQIERPQVIEFLGGGTIAGIVEGTGPDFFVLK